MLAGSAAGLGLFAMPGGAGGQVRLDITKGVVEPIPIAISPFAGDDVGTRDIGLAVADVIAANLESSGLFRVIDRRAYIQDPESLRQTPRFAEWRPINAQALVTGAVSRPAADRLVIEFRLWDVFSGSQLRGLRYELAADGWRRVAHQISDVTYERLTGEAGYFDTRIVYVSESGPRTRRVKRLAVMDQDGANHRFLTDGGQLVLTPQIAPDGRRVAYFVLRTPVPQIMMLDLATGRTSPLGEFPGMSFTPRFAPDGSVLLLTVARDGNSDIFSFDTATRRTTQLTQSPAIDTSPSFSPRGDRIVFNSDRGGTPQLYTMNRDGSNVQRISFGSGRYGSPAWSPRGDLIAFTKIQGGYFHIGIMEPDGANERLLTRSFLDESPAWAPNGRIIVFTRENPQTDRTRLMTIDITGYNERELPTPLDASDPAWSGLIP
ncbi:MAG: Tol-Pal system beta propeller repeat protein TolB [Geminicoccaceae bacterium]